MERLAALRTLKDRGAHFVLAATDKRPLGARWQKTAPAFASVEHHVADGGLVGVIPASIGAVVIDVDDGGPEGVAAVTEALKPCVPIAISATRRVGGAHVWYRSPPNGTGNRKWHLGTAMGDIRGSAGFVILWDAPQVAEGFTRHVADSQVPDLDRLPRVASSARGAGAVRAAPRGARNETLNREAFEAARAGNFNRAAFRAAGLQAGLPAPEVDRTLTSAERAGAQVAVFPAKDAAALETALETLGVALRYNLRAQRGEMSRDGGQTWVEMTDRSTAHLRRDIAERFSYWTDRGPKPLYYGRESWKLWIDALLYKRERDPFLDWLESLSDWDGTERVRNWLADVFELEDKSCPLTAWAGQFVFLGAVQRAFEPGAKLDEMPVLIGRGGIGKSTILRLALPPDQPDWFADGLNLAAPAKERAEALQGRVIVEAAEMTGATRAELQSLKSFLSRMDDGAVRLSYRANPETMLRRAIIVGTADKPDPLPNDDNLRRFVPVTLTSGNPGALHDYMEQHRAQLWAEALVLHHQGVQARLPDDLKPVQGRATEQARRRDDILEDAVAGWIAGGRTGFTLAEAASGVGLIERGAAARLSMRDQRRLGAALRNIGFERRKKRRDGRQQWMWHRAA